MFKFNFSPDEGGEDGAVTESDVEGERTKSRDAYRPSVDAALVRVDPQRVKVSNDARRRVKLKSSANYMTVVKPESSSCDVPKTAWSVASERDVLPGVYEGGLALWECALDLSSWLDAHRNRVHITSSSVVLELGCGFGLPGIWALKEGKCGRCVFQDLNADVLASATSQHIVANLGRDCLSKRVSLIAGDWFDAKLVGLLQAAASPSDAMYEVILTAETLYTPALTKRMVELLSRLLRPKTGIAVIAAKRFYFGGSLGGGSGLLCSLCQRPGSVLDAKVVSVVEDGVSNIREIVVVSRRQ